MEYDMMDLFAETAAIIARLDEDNDSAAIDYVKRILSCRPAFEAGTGYRLYREDAAIRYAQWLLSAYQELGISRCVDILYQYAGQFDYVDMPALTAEQVEQTLQMVEQLFPYTQTLADMQPMEILLFDAQHISRNGETTAVFTPDGMRGCICMYRMQEENLDPVTVFLHELGHLLHIKGTGAMDQIPQSFLTYLRRIGAKHDGLTIPQLQDVFADTFVLAVMSQFPALKVPIPGLPKKTLEICFAYMQAYFRELL